jgi:hypothetical protein
MTSSPLLAMTLSHNSTFSRRDAPKLCMNPSPRIARAWGMPGARCARSRACSVVNTRVSHRRPPGSPGIPARNGFNGFLRALPGDRAFLSPSSSGLRFCQPGRARKTSAGLDAGVEASGPHDFAVRDKHFSSARCRSLTGNPPCDLVARKMLPRPLHPAPRP